MSDMENKHFLDSKDKKSIFGRELEMKRERDTDSADGAVADGKRAIDTCTRRNDRMASAIEGRLDYEDEKRLLDGRALLDEDAQAKYSDQDRHETEERKNNDEMRKHLEMPRRAPAENRPKWHSEQVRANQKMGTPDYLHRPLFNMGSMPIEIREKSDDGHINDRGTDYLAGMRSSDRLPNARNTDCLTNARNTDFQNARNTDCLPNTRNTDFQNAADAINCFLGMKENVQTEAILGLLKIKRKFIDKIYVDQGYTYKTQLQLGVLEDVLLITPYPDNHTRDTLGILLKLNPRSIQIWFQNIRQNTQFERRKAGTKDCRITGRVGSEQLIDIYLDNLRKFKKVF